MKTLRSCLRLESFLIKTPMQRESMRGSTLVVEAAHHAGRGCSRAVLGEAPVQLQHVLGRLPLGSRGPPLGPPSREVHAGQQKVAEEVPGVQQRLISRPVGAEGTACAPTRRRQQQDVQPEDGAQGHAHGREEERRRGARSEDEKIQGRGDLRTSGWGGGDDWLPLGTTRTVLLPRLIWQVGCEGRAVLGLKALEMSLWPPFGPPLPDPPGETGHS